MGGTCCGYPRGVGDVHTVVLVHTEATRQLYTCACRRGGDVCTYATDHIELQHKMINRETALIEVKQ